MRRFRVCQATDLVLAWMYAALNSFVLCVLIVLINMLIYQSSSSLRRALGRCPTRLKRPCDQVYGMVSGSRLTVEFAFSRARSYAPPQPVSYLADNIFSHECAIGGGDERTAKYDPGTGNCHGGWSCFAQEAAVPSTQLPEAPQLQAQTMQPATVSTSLISYGVPYAVSSSVTVTPVHTDVPPRTIDKSICW